MQRNRFGTQDNAKDCLNDLPDQVRPEQLKAGWCDVCMNKECVRSRWGDSQWLARMLAQKEALLNPKFGDPDDPQFSHLKTLNFEQIDERTLKHYGGWVEVRQDGSVINHAPAPKDEESSEKVENALKSLQPEPEEVAAPAQVEIEKPEPKPEVRVQEQPAQPARKKEEKTEEPKAPARPAPKPKSKLILPQTAPNQSGKVLGTPQTQKPSAILSGRAAPKDPWAVDPSPNKRGPSGKLTVRVSDGKVVKK